MWYVAACFCGSVVAAHAALAIFVFVTLGVEHYKSTKRRNIVEDHQLKMLSNQDLIAEYKQATRLRDLTTANMLLKEIERRGIKVETER